MLGSCSPVDFDKRVSNFYGMIYATDTINNKFTYCDKQFKSTNILKRENGFVISKKNIVCYVVLVLSKEEKKKNSVLVFKITEEQIITNK